MLLTQMLTNALGGDLPVLDEVLKERTAALGVVERAGGLDVLR